MVPGRITFYVLENILTYGVLQQYHMELLFLQ
jgi:hypothetical protein